MKPICNIVLLFALSVSVAAGVGCGSGGSSNPVETVYGKSTSPDGKKVIIEKNFVDSSGKMQPYHDLYYQVVGIDRETHIPSGDQGASDVDWSPDSDMIFYETPNSDPSHSALNITAFNSNGIDRHIEGVNGDNVHFIVTGTTVFRGFSADEKEYLFTAPFTFVDFQMDTSTGLITQLPRPN